VALYRVVADRDSQEQDLATLEILAERQNNSRNRAIVALRYAVFAYDLGDIHEAQQLAKTAIEFAESVNARDVIAQAYRILPLTLTRQGQLQEALKAAQIGIELTQQVGDRPSEGQIYNDLGLILLDQKEHEKARQYFEKSLSIAKETGNRRLEAMVFNNMGKISGEIENDYAVAQKFFENTLEVVREIGHRIGECYAFGNLGWVTSMQGDFALAQMYQKESLKVARETGNRYLEGMSTINLSAMLTTQENYKSALKYANQGLELAREIGDRSAEAWALIYLGHANLGLGNYQEAATAYEETLYIRYSFEQYSLAMEPLAGLAQVALEKGEFKTALQYIDKILEHLANGGSLDGAEEPLRVYLTAYKILAANIDSRSDQVLDIAYALLQEQVNKIKNRKNKKMYVQNVPWRKEIEELWLQNQRIK